MRKSIFGAIACAVVLAAPMAASAASTDYGCDAINFSQEVLQKMPNAKALCRGVTEKNGGAYVKYVGKVVSTKQDATTIEFLDKNNKPVSRVTFKPAADQMAYLSGKKVKYSELKKGDELHFYIEHNKWGLFASPDDSAMTIMGVEQL